MVIGNGLVARRFASYQADDRFLIFASGVSNSKTKNPDAYGRELELLRENLRLHPAKTFVYFSTCSIYDPAEKESAYVKHKLQIEELIRTLAAHYHIFRISNLAGLSSNPNTVLNFFFYHVKKGINFDLWTRACRNIIDIDDAYTVMDHILQQDLFPNAITNIANPVNHPVREIISTIENFLEVKSNYIEIEKGTCFAIDVSPIQPILQQSGISFPGNYLANLLEKYFKK